VYWHVAQDAAAKLGVSLQSEEVSDPKDFEAAFDDMDRQHANALLVLSDAFMALHRTLLAQLALKHRLPAVYGHDQYTAAGGLISCGPSLPELQRPSTSQFHRA
jgi:putative tryptophan/tyrosine transport system substrate-binding protein